MIKPKRIAFDKRLIPAAIFDREKRPHVERSNFGITRTWVSCDGQYQVVCRQLLLGTPDCHYPPRWHAEERWHRSPEAAIWCRIPGTPWGGFRTAKRAFAAVAHAVKNKTMKKQEEQEVA